MSTHTKPFEEKMQKSTEALEKELDTIRAGRANPRVLDKITADCYGQQMPLNQLANITVPEARLLQIQPYDASTIKAIEKAILSSDLGINPGNDGKIIRLAFPELTEERRKLLAKDVKKKGEDAKVAMRNIRREAMDLFKKQQKSNELTEDDLKNVETEIQKLTDKYIAELDKRIDAKNKEILTV
ncbi:MAG: ribosome recycling factor [Firmicutes bacterium]|nr:ribosome recycling factor [Bacillota bacterium]